ncbi:hypothetical protein [Commensalibacter communis]|uniref:hypothetical protein n=1 Tax=Commensalibacter communis TaxID=2972786 RepID=UPI0022FF54EE|nr:hypothetical protein [Commensalibacter communis]CAI3949234.1 unnamed protein product [Commensalibacter communis]CAI3949461.1 unnamed protein product [Commensalibacter communis]
MPENFKIYETNSAVKFLFMMGYYCFAFIVTTAFYILFHLKHNYFMAMVGGSIPLYFILFPKIYLYPDRIYFKQNFIKYNCFFNSGNFQLIEKKGLAAFAVSFKLTRVIGITYTQYNKPKSKIALGWMLKKSEVKEMFDYIQKQKTIFKLPLQNKLF